MSDVDDVLAAFDQLYDAIVARDGAALLALFVDDADVTFWGTEQHAQAFGPDELRAVIERISAPGGSVSFEWPQRHARTEGDIGWVHALGHVVVTPPGRETLSYPYRTTGVLLRRDGRWLWHTYHGSEPRGHT